MTDTLKTLATIARHREMVKIAIGKLVDELEERATAHDLSKYMSDEVEGYERINKAARDHAYGSEEYRAGLKAEKPTIALHFSRNSHHPEFHEHCADMGFLDIIEMVCDWWSASRTYGNNTLRESIHVHRQRFLFTGTQWDLIGQLVDFLEPEGEA